MKMIRGMIKVYMRRVDISAMVASAFMCFVLFAAPSANAAVYFMNDGGDKVSELGVADAGQNKGKVVVVGADGKEVTLGVGGSGGSCGVLCTILTAKIENGKAVIGTAVPDIEFADPKARLKILFANTLNASAFEMVMATPELATASVGKMLGIVGAEGANAKIGLVDTKDQRVDVLITEMAQAKADIAALKLQLAEVSAALAVEVKEATSCRSETIPVLVEKVVGSGDWVVTPIVITVPPKPARAPKVPMPLPSGMPPMWQSPPLIQV